ALPRTLLDVAAFDPGSARRDLVAHFGVASLEASGCESLPRAAAAAGAVFRYVRETQKRDPAHATAPRTRHQEDGLVIDGLTRRNLELVENLADGGRRGTLLDVLDETATAMGSRLLREWILRPLVHVEPIQDRLDAVEELAFRTVARGRLREALHGVQDLDRIVGRITLGTASPRDLVALARSLRALPDAAAAAEGYAAPLVRGQLKDLDPPLEVAADVESTLVDEPLPAVRDGGLVRDRVDSELHERAQMSHGAASTIVATAQRARRGHPRRPGDDGRGVGALQLRQAARGSGRRAPVRRGPPPGHGARAARAVRGQRPQDGRRGGAAPRPHRPQHGRQVDLPPPDRARRGHGPDGLLRPRPAAQSRRRRPDLHPRGGDRPH